MALGLKLISLHIVFIFHPFINTLFINNSYYLIIYKLLNDISKLILFIEKLFNNLFEIANIIIYNNMLIDLHSRTLILNNINKILFKSLIFFNNSLETDKSIEKNTKLLSFW